ncbi:MULTISPECIES: plasmid segregation protein ParM domain-containing protein [Morganellaceae]|uniref:Plasmid segregation protein ParM n=1 Tax=Providencia rettgeri TaxID=587 RepID=A0AB35LEG9_PRORE|nr:MULTISPECIES: plasmid segregation protein ParM domain-containing protein [Morganellaceae]ELB1546760.1 recombinase [Morganella morganii]EKV4067980.1 recombinase [Proteus mirabilis]MCI9768603.1 recombinase [Proteus mirabilis]MCI9772193.1 recombinase [Proteus mirabilis]MCI9775785.1 recombinase [Proteus mirabilis]
MRIYIDDGSTNIKMLWEQDQEGEVIKISPNSFKRGWGTAFGTGKPFNYTVDNEKYSFDIIDPDNLPTNNVAWQYSPLNAVAVQHALQISGLPPQEVEIVVTLPLAEFYDQDAQYRMDNIQRKKDNLMREVQVSRNEPFKIKKVTVRPESIPAGISLCDELKPNHSVLIIDIGGTTTDISMVSGQMTSVSRIFGDPTLGVSLVTNEVKRALVNASTETSSYNADQLIINRHDENYLLDNINSVDDIQMVKDAMNSSIERLNTRVLDAVSTFKGYTHVMVIGGGAALSADAIRKKIAIQPERFYVAEEPQFALVRGLKLLG